ncbi:hypothetical protein [Actinospongicola halichondriae]|uniref:hypothetical protein n=1 Tax=Actinospongicola halichondriae TaxID=3236844 RepID=UPI003D4471A0
MPATTPPKGRPTTGRLDRSVASRRQRSRSVTKKFIWALLAIAVVAAVIVLGSGTGGNSVNTTGTRTNVLVPTVLLLRMRRWPAARS